MVADHDDTGIRCRKPSAVAAIDADEHRLGQKTLTSTGPATIVGWGPAGHPVSLSASYAVSTTTHQALHWDGDLILFVTDDAGNVTDFKAGLDGDITPRDRSYTGLSVYDRDPAGVIVETSNASGSTGFNPLDPATVSGAGTGGTVGYQSANVPEQYVRGDGFMVAGVQINGVRAFDPNLGAWTTPDAYEGELHDPASQQKYMFNRGNPVDYNDPSGYSPDDLHTVSAEESAALSPYFMRERIALAQQSAAQSNGTYRNPTGFGALRRAYESVLQRLGLTKPLPKIDNGYGVGKARFGQPMRGTPKKGYRLDPGHDRDPANPESGPHFNYHDFTKGKRDSGGIKGVVPLESQGKG